MTLTQYMDKHKVTLAELSDRTGLSAASLSRISKGQQNISLDTARAIVAATGGKVTLNDLASLRAAA